MSFSPYSWFPKWGEVAPVPMHHAMQAYTCHGGICSWALCKIRTPYFRVNTHGAGFSCYIRWCEENASLVQRWPQREPTVQHEIRTRLRAFHNMLVVLRWCLILLFFWTCSIFQYTETRSLRFRSWLCYHGLVLARSIEPNRIGVSPEDGGRASSRKVVVSFQNIEWWIKSRKIAILNVTHQR
jgi:hypothetical protein